jgi:hypothetical protein
MKGKIGFTLLFLLGLVLGFVLKDVRAQQPTVEKKAVAQGSQPAAETPYTVNSSIEFGVRGIAIEGNADRYRSDLNYTPEFRIFDSSFLMRSKDNDAPLLDSLMVSSFGWGKDPNRYLRVNAEKTGAYRFDVNYRRFDYFNSLTNIALGQHISNTEYRQGDFDLTILPQNEKIKVNLGYSLDRNSGPGVSTIRFNGDEYPAAYPVRMAADEYRAGVDTKLSVFDISFMQGWRFFKEDTQYLINTPNVGNNPTNTAVINNFYRSAPTRGDNAFTRLSVHTLLRKKLDFTGRYIYTNGSTDYTFFQNGTGVDSSGNKVNSDIITVNGAAKRPNGMGDLAATFFVTDRFTISETFRVNNFRINGGDLLAEALLRSKVTAGNETVLPPTLTNTISFRTLKYRRYLNTIEGNYDISRWLSVHAGYRYTDRHIELGSSDINIGTAPKPELEKVDNSTNTLIFGFKAKPVKICSLYFDLERGSADNVFTRVDNYEVTNVRVRSILRPTKSLSFNASIVTKDNSKPAITEDNRTFGVNTKSRNYSSSVDWTPSEKLTVTGGFTHWRVTSDADIIFFLANNLKTLGQSRYFMRDNSLFLTGFFRLHQRIDLFAGYRLHKDPGQGDRVATTAILIGSFRYEFQSPEAKFVVKLRNNVDWIAGYQYFDYKEQFAKGQFYRAHLPYTSVRFSFGRRE